MKFIPILLLATAPIFGYSQRVHADFFGGIVTYQGELQGKRFSINQSHPAVGIGASYYISDKFILRSGFTYGVVEGNDKNNSAAKSVELRNLNFKSAVSELHLGIEYNLFKLEGKSLTPYLFAGVASFHFNPYTKDVSGTKVFLKPLSTEGQGLDAYPDRKNYTLTQFAIPFGGGIKFKVSDGLQVGLEVGLRKLFTDYLDDVSDTYVDATLLQTSRGTQAIELSYRGDEINPNTTYPVAGSQRGTPKTKDWYYFSGLRISKRLNSNGGGRKNKIGCPQKVF